MKKTGSFGVNYFDSRDFSDKLRESLKKFSSVVTTTPFSTGALILIPYFLTSLKNCANNSIP